MPSVLSGFIEMLYLVNSSVKWLSVVSIFRTAVYGLECELYNAISSAYAATETSGRTVLRRCAVYTLNSNGESTAP